MKKFLALLLCAVALNFFMPVQSYANEIDLNTDDTSAVDGEIEKFYASLPVAKDYKVRQRPILIQGAMNVETKILVHALKNPVAYRELNYLFVAGTYKNYPVVVARTEQGISNAAASTALAIKKFNPVAVINQGTAGGMVPTLHRNDIVIGSKSFPVAAIKTAYSPKGAGVDFKQQIRRGTFAYDEAKKIFQPCGEYPADKTLLDVAEKVAAANKNFNVTTGAISSADWWMDWVDYVSFLHETYGVTCTEMETASAAQICHNAGVSFIGIRVISDNVSGNEEYSFAPADTCQNFVLLVTESYIRDVLKK